MAVENKLDLQIAAIRDKAGVEAREKEERYRFISSQVELLQSEIAGSAQLMALGITSDIVSGSLMIVRNGQRLGECCIKDNLLVFSEGSRQDVLFTATDASDAGTKFVEYLARRGLLKGA
jgi:hypothetical protein